MHVPHPGSREGTEPLAATTTSIRIFLLGRFEITREARALPAAAWTRRKAAALLQRLALERRLLKDQAIEFLWPEADLASGANNLYRTLHALRQTLDTTLGSGTADATVTFTDGVLRLTDSVWVDAHEFERLCAEASAAPSVVQPAQLEQALALYVGDLLPDQRYAEWALAPRETLRSQRREASLALAAERRDTHAYTAAIGLLTRLLAQDVADEPIHRELMRLYALAGRRHDALRQYQACVDALARELDMPPEPETSALYAQILGGELASLAAPAWSPVAPVMLAVEQVAPLVGRAGELDTLRLWLQAAWRGQGQTILLAGDSGVGKTRLAFEILRTAAEAGITTLLGAAYEQEGQLAYQPFVEAFDRYLAEKRRPRTDHPITHFQRRGLSDEQEEQWALFNTTAAFLSGLAAHMPAVLLLDDLHAADPASLQLFHYLARQTRTAPVILLATYRSDFADAVAPFNALLTALYREHLSETLHLSPLLEDAVASVVAQTLGSAAAPELVRAVYEITEGNPFFVEEMTRALLKSGQVEQDEQWRLRPNAELDMPADLAGLLRERVRRLGAPVEAVLTTAAAIGREFPFDVLRRAAKQPASTLLDALDAALAGHVVEETAEGYRFRHPLTRRALYDALSRARRAHLHGQIAETIEVVGARQGGGLDPLVEDLAFHYDRSDRRDRALPYLLRAGEKAASVYAFEGAISYFERALALMDALHLADVPRRWMILEQLGWWGIILADTPRAVARFEQALALPMGEDWQPAGHDRVMLYRGAVMALITAGDIAAAETHLRAALAEIDEREDAADYAYLLYKVAQLHWHRNEHREAFDVAQRSLAIAERVNDPTAIAHAFEMLALACHSLGEWQSGISFEQQRTALVGPSLDVTEAFDVHL
jgi:DNA-binding SARP family transcriptional activator/tetratricopeptide (TPR) repeat protein